MRGNCAIPSVGEAAPGKTMCTWNACIQQTVLSRSSAPRRLPRLDERERGCTIIIKLFECPEIGYLFNVEEVPKGFFYYWGLCKYRGFVTSYKWELADCLVWITYSGKYWTNSWPRSYCYRCRKIWEWNLGTRWECILVDKSSSFVTTSTWRTWISTKLDHWREVCDRGCRTGGRPWASLGQLSPQTSECTEPQLPGLAQWKSRGNWSMFWYILWLQRGTQRSKRRAKATEAFDEDEGYGDSDFRYRDKSWHMTFITSFIKLKLSSATRESYSCCSQNERSMARWILFTKAQTVSWMFIRLQRS